MSIDLARREALLKKMGGRPPTEPSGNTANPPPAVVSNAQESIVAFKEAGRELSADGSRGERKGRRRRDIRSVSATGRIVQFSSRISEDLDARIGEIIERRQDEINAARRGPKYKYGICNFLEEAVFLFENTTTAGE